MLRTRLIDLAVDAVDVSALAAALLAAATEPQLARREGRWLGARLLPRRAAGRLAWPADGGMAGLEVSADRTLEGLRLAAAAASAPAAGEVTVAVRAAGVNFRDVLNALGPVSGRCRSAGRRVRGRGGPPWARGWSGLGVGERGGSGWRLARFATQCTAGGGACCGRRRGGGLRPAAAATVPG